MEGSRSNGARKVEVVEAVEIVEAVEVVEVGRSC